MPMRGVPRSTLYSLTARSGGADLIDQREQRAAERNQLGERLPAQELARDLEEELRGHVGVDDLAVRRDDDDRIGQRIEDGIGIGRMDAARFECHAAALQAKSS